MAKTNLRPTTGTYSQDDDITIVGCLGCAGCAWFVYAVGFIAFWVIVALALIYYIHGH